MTRITGPGGPLPLGSINRDGRTVPVIAGVPPTLPAYFGHFCREHAAKTFLVSGTERLSFGDTYTAAQSLARGLVDRFGVVQGDRVGIAMCNSPAWIIFYMAILMAGGVATLLNGWWQRDELLDAVGDVDCRLVFADAPRAARLAGAKARIVVIDDAQPLPDIVTALLQGASVRTELPRMVPDDWATILFTSGSTGRSKGALSDHRAVTQCIFNYLAQTLVMQQVSMEDGIDVNRPPATLLCMPLFHVTGEIPVFLLSMAIGRKLVIMPKWDAEEAMRLIQAEQVTYFVGVPLMSYEILTHRRRGLYDLSTVTDFVAGGAPRPPGHVIRMHAELEGKPLIGYGLTESNGIGSVNVRSNYLAKPDSAGRAALPLVELILLDEAGRHLPRGTRGEVAMRSVCNFREYWRDPAATAAAFTADGFLRTGDIGYLDDDGYLFIIDRKKDIIIRGGENIACQEVEAAIYRHPDVVECVVFGLPDERLGEIPACVIHFRSGKSGSAQEMRDFLAPHIAAFKVPQATWSSPMPLPRLGSEKIDKLSLRAHCRLELIIGPTLPASTAAENAAGWALRRI
ncbi:class I adenylate-forming enzyme family protein [Niveispirillum sp. KHB5.9]|uniref:class I adenylate-forming enzyme family protein n=1 Tax=Niveispirillum sp. KHB5.9 TaxID=3400269 RepID=UPI003A863487